MALNKTGPENKERLRAAAIKRNGEVIERGFKSHYQLRQALGDPSPQTGNPNDIEGFITSSGRFLTRREAVPVGIACKQLAPGWADVQRELLSSDINW